MAEGIRLGCQNPAFIVALPKKSRINLDTAPIMYLKLAMNHFAHIQWIVFVLNNF